MVTRKMRVLVLLWHPPQLGAIAGGFRIIQEILRRTPPNIEVNALDASPSILRCNEKIRIYEYSLPTIVERLKQRCFAAGKIVEFLLSTILITRYALKLNAIKQYDVIYVPFSELLHISLPAFLVKLVFKNKLVLALLNVQVYGGSINRAYTELLKSGYSRLIAFLAITGWPLVGFFQTLVHNQAESVITLSRDLAGRIMQGLNGKKEVDVVPTGIDYKLITRLPDQDKVYDGIFVGRYAPEKGIFDLIKAWKFVVEKHPEARIILVGPSNPIITEKINSEINKFGLQRNMILHGPEADYKEVIKLYKKSRINVFLSYIEGWGLVPIEGLACGIPVVAYDQPVYQENIRNCDAAFLVPVGDFNKAAEKIIQILGKPRDELSQLSEWGKKFASQYDWDILADKTFSLLEEVAAY